MDFKFLLVALNAKYIHSNLGLYSIRNYAKKHGVMVDIAEYTINHQLDDILCGIYEQKPDVLAFSCYIWNISMVRQVAEEYHKIDPDTPIWLGGPEVSFDATEQLKKYPWCKGIMLGEGEETATELARLYRDTKQVTDGELANIKGIAFSDGEVHITPARPLLPMDDIPFAYDNLEGLEHRIIYYETSRGCPFGCSYCLSSVDKQVRFRSMELVEKELQFFLDNKVPQVKFVDRTFNCNKEHTMAIWKYIYEHDNKVTNFHFEIAADLLSDEEIAYIRQFRKGLIQLEIGVQSTNPKTIEAIRRKQDIHHLKNVVDKIHQPGNIHQHLDLIAGLPYEDIASFAKSFDDVYHMKPDQLQLGFLKVLKGSPVYAESEKYNLVYKESAPYEVLYNQWISYKDVLRLKRVEEMVETYYNSFQFQATLQYLVGREKSPFAFYDGLATFYKEGGMDKEKHSRNRYFEILLEYACTGREKMDETEYLHHKSMVKELLVFDLYSRENVKNRPEWAKEGVSRETRRQFYDDELLRRKYLPEYEAYKPAQVASMTHFEHFTIDIPKFLSTGRMRDKEIDVIFDYGERNPLNHQARIVLVHES